MYKNQKKCNNTWFLKVKTTQRSKNPPDVNRTNVCIITK
jgi:hypothetical protein